jgi:hypothetical protein
MSAAPTIAPRESTAFDVMIAVFTPFLPAGIDFVRGQVNRVAEPMADDFLVFWPLSSTLLSFPTQSFHDGFYDSPATAGATSLLASTEVVVQIEVHGPNSANTVNILNALSRSIVMTEAFEAMTPDMQVLYADDPHQAPFENEQQQTEWRWIVDFHFQVNNLVTVAQDFFDKAVVKLISVDAAYKT